MVTHLAPLDYDDFTKWGALQELRKDVCGIEVYERLLEAKDPRGIPFHETYDTPTATIRWWSRPPLAYTIKGFRPW